MQCNQIDISTLVDWTELTIYSESKYFAYWKLTFLLIAVVIIVVSWWQCNAIVLKKLVYKIIDTEWTNYSESEYFAYWKPTFLWITIVIIVIICVEIVLMMVN